MNYTHDELHLRRTTHITRLRPITTSIRQATPQWLCKRRISNIDVPSFRSGARLAGRRRRARERVRGMSESPQATRESVGEGVVQVVFVCCGVVLVTFLTALLSYRIGWGGCG